MISRCKDRFLLWRRLRPLHGLNPQGLHKNWYAESRSTEKWDIWLVYSLIYPYMPSSELFNMSSEVMLRHIRLVWSSIHDITCYCTVSGLYITTKHGTFHHCVSLSIAPIVKAGCRLKGRRSYPGISSDVKYQPWSLRVPHSKLDVRHSYYADEAHRYRVN